ncbi:MAG: alkaline phosphatase D family protein [Wenzhouxiangellaceae bacterium]|nr:alkaline phosphatase D family protein [Wenzhouxiangellaceae bacterium]
MRRTVFLLLILGAAPAAAASLLAGPMPGASAMRAAEVWIQADEETVARLRYWPEGDPSAARLGPERDTRQESAHTAELSATGLEPGTTYVYEVLLDGQPQAARFPQTFVTQPLWQWRDDPPDFRFALGSCAYVNEPVYDRPGRPYGGDYHIFESIANADPDFMLWLGDNVYYREVDWDAPSSMYARYGHTRQLPEMQRLLTTAHHFATWDDHDYGPNNSDRSYRLRGAAQQVFHDFWPNPVMQAAGTGGVTTSFQWHDVEFFLLDNRSFRQANERVTGEQTILGEAQIRWLIDALRSSRASFRFVVLGGQFVNSAEVYENYDSLAPAERRDILDRIRAEDIPGVVFLTGDRHHSVLLRMDRRGTYPLHDWTVSPLTSGAGTPNEGEGQYRVDGSLYTERNFGTAEVTGPFGDRTLTMRLHDVDGNEVWSHVIHQRDLR